jgi:putative FmdB family regulatory protein
MPLYDYACSDCGEHFEALVLRNNTASCPKCQGQNLEQLISLFAVDSESVRQGNIKKARAKNAKIQRDKSMAEQEAIANHHD